MIVKAEHHANIYYEVLDSVCCSVNIDHAVFVYIELCICVGHICGSCDHSGGKC